MGVHRIGLFVHPSRPIEGPLQTLRAWAQQSGAELVQIDSGHPDSPRVAPAGPVTGADLVVAIGGDGTVLSALRAAAPQDVPVLGVACGSLGALTTVAAQDLGEALDLAVTGALPARSLPALTLRDEHGEIVIEAINDLVLIRRATAQLTVEVTVGGELYTRAAGDGVIVATALGSSAYTMAAGGPLLFGPDAGFVCTPLAMHGGNAPPLVVPAQVELGLVVTPGYGGFDLEVDGHRHEPAGTRYAVTLSPGHVRLLGAARAEGPLAGLRRRGLLLDSPRVQARVQRSGPPC